MIWRLLRSLFCRHERDPDVAGELFDVGRQKAFLCRKCKTWYVL